MINDPTVPGERPDPDELLPPQILSEWTGRVGEVDRVSADVFAAGMRRTLARTLHRLDDGTVFVITGDIPAMWLRDSATQMRPYLRLLRANPGELTALADLVVGVTARQFAFIAHDPYANAFNAAPNGNCHDESDLGDDPWIWERKFEIDSLCFPFQLAEQLYDATGRTDQFDETFLAAVRRAVETLSVEVDHETRSTYRFVREGTSDTLGPNGFGKPVGKTGMVWSGFRPSDDACHHHYLVPANLMAAQTLELIARRVSELDAELAAHARALAVSIRRAVATHGVVDQMFAYEVDGLGGQLLADDANMPSLLSLPLTADMSADDPLYRRTRAFVLSDDNPYFYRGSLVSGPGSPHTPAGYVWPIALAVEGLTTADAARARTLLRTIAATTAGTGYVHESFDPSDDRRFTRSWFSWADSMFCELALTLA